MMSCTSDHVATANLSAKNTLNYYRPSWNVRSVPIRDTKTGEINSNAAVLVSAGDWYRNQLPGERFHDAFERLSLIHI